MFKSKLKKLFAGGAIAVALVITFAFSSGNGYFEVNKSLDIFTTLYKELNTYYVDTLNHQQLIGSAMESIATSLDPYTDVISEENMADYRQMTTGRYGGIGSMIGTRDGFVVISEPYEGFPAQRAGLIAGDKIISIDGKSVKGQNSDDVSKQLKGKAGTQVTVKVERLNDQLKEEEKTITIIREEIKIKNVPYFGVIENNIGYIQLSNFTEKAGAEVHAAFNQLIQKNKIKGLVLDLRGNPGGLLNEAINVANVFVPKNVEIVTTKGRIEDQYKRYYTENEPVDINMPMVVLIDTNSASASEIVSGSLQDLDRAIIVGQNSYGKGLVQSTLSLPYNYKLKLTTAKYYIPSGRCIQAINYADKGEDGSLHKTSDSLRAAFKTRNGRTVFDGKGIEPDFVITPEYMSPVIFPLIVKNYIFDFATRYAATHKSIGNPRTFSLSDKEYDEFVKFVLSKNFEYDTRSEKALEYLKKLAEKEEQYASIKHDLEEIKNKLSAEKKQDIYKEKKDILKILESEIISRYYWQNGRTEFSFSNDKEVKKAVELCSNPNLIKQTLHQK